MLSEQVYTRLREAIMRGEHAPGAALKPQDLAREQGVSLAVVRVVGDGLADRLPNRGFAVPAWEARVRAAHHRPSRTPPFESDKGEHLSGAWSEAHRVFHPTLLDGCGNPVLLETFDRMWTASELARDADAAAEALTRHLTPTAAAQTDES
ncbi:GntR family transcriptional regulator [Amycolatopsis sp. WAC 01416]|uniref:FCD domain-containing protein n=1 Tax=Amycolatopsis sp. WAC 01416 TaxID=2203196 RepID=UPI000F792155|nr:FCD domain-containing protein [Amycolatopsis sp. WAC 01416]RSN27253.1 GntR family transcriptional regulator [Amycolatopsis sp. WAC 01416]